MFDTDCKDFGGGKTARVRWSMYILWITCAHLQTQVIQSGSLPSYQDVASKSVYISHPAVESWKISLYQWKMDIEIYVSFQDTHQRGVVLLEGQYIWYIVRVSQKEFINQPTENITRARWGEWAWYSPVISHRKLLSKFKPFQINNKWNNRLSMKFLSTKWAHIRKLTTTTTKKTCKGINFYNGNYFYDGNYFCY